MRVCLCVRVCVSVCVCVCVCACAGLDTNNKNTSRQIAKTRNDILKRSTTYSETALATTKSHHAYQARRAARTNNKECPFLEIALAPIEGLRCKTNKRAALATFVAAGWLQPGCQQFSLESELPGYNNIQMTKADAYS